MKLAELEQQIKAPGAKGKVTLMSLLRTVSDKGVLVDTYAPHLAQANSLEEFLELIYQDESLLMDDAWGCAAKLTHPAEVLQHFTPLGVERGKQVRNGQIEFRSARGDFTLRAPHGADVTDVYVFEDGSINDLALATAGKFDATCKIAGVAIDGVFSIFHSGTSTVIMPWEIDENGMRPKARGFSAVRACQQIKPKSDNC